MLLKSQLFLIIKPSNRVAFVIIDEMCVENKSELKKLFYDWVYAYIR